MRRRITSVAARIGIVTGAAFASIALSAFAATTWTAPSATPPNGNVDAPLNVGSTAQVKVGGSIQINGGFGIAGGPFIFRPTTAPSVGQVMTALDTGGSVGWMSTSTLAGAGASGTHLTTTIRTGSNSSTSDHLYAVATCLSGEFVLGGGFSQGATAGATDGTGYPDYSYPSGSSWNVHTYSTTNRVLTAYVICGKNVAN